MMVGKILVATVGMMTTLGQYVVSYIRDKCR